MARLDTCVTVVDAAEFHNNLESMKAYNYEEGTIGKAKFQFNISLLDGGH